MNIILEFIKMGKVFSLIVNISVYVLMVLWVVFFCVFKNYFFLIWVVLIFGWLKLLGSVVRSGFVMRIVLRILWRIRMVFLVRSWDLMFLRWS